MNIEEYQNTTCSISQYCLRNEYNGIYTLNLQGHIYNTDHEIIEFFDAKIIKNHPQEFNNYVNVQNHEDRILISAEGHWWQIMIELNNISNISQRNKTKDIFEGYEFTQNEIDRCDNISLNSLDLQIIPLKFDNFEGKDHRDFGIPTIIWSIMIGMIITKL